MLKLLLVFFCLEWLCSDAALQPSMQIKNKSAVKHSRSLTWRLPSARKRRAKKLQRMNASALMLHHFGVSNVWFHSRKSSPKLKPSTYPAVRRQRPHPRWCPIWRLWSHGTESRCWCQKPHWLCPDRDWSTQKATNLLLFHQNKSF